MMGIQRKMFSLMAILVLVPTLLVWGQDNKQDIPDAPSAAQPPQNFPADAPPAPKEQPNSAPTEPAEQPKESRPVQAPLPFPGDAPAAADTPQTAPGVKTMPGTKPKDDGSNTREEIYKISTTTNFIQIPVTVKDQDGKLVAGLVPKDFQVLENGKQQKMAFFTSDPFPLSAAVIIDLGMPDSLVQKVNRTFSALQGAFSQFDEVALYTYSSTTTRLQGFGAVSQELADTLNDLKTKRGRNDGVPVTSGPFGPQGPVINGTPVTSPVPILSTPPKEAHVINDAILQAALDLSKRDRSRRKIIFVISDGREVGSTAGYSDVLKVLLTNNVVVYGLGVGGSAAPIYGKLQRIHVPRLGTGDILPKYSSATGGELFTEISKDSIDAVYARAIEEARNQYTIGYYAAKGSPGGYRDIEIRIARPDCKDYAAPCVRTTAKAGYYPAPPAPSH
ncbi:MAG TPA: VWA domain-containing protein [Terriglobales bacterium]|nr:VWA domain-containing protein [Terriglobales bacterium]